MFTLEDEESDDLDIPANIEELSSDEQEEIINMIDRKDEHNAKKKERKETKRKR